MEHIYSFVLNDNGEAKATVLGTVSVSNNWVDIGIDGFKSAGGNDLVGLELYEGRLMLRIWGDEKEEDPTHIIDLSNAIRVDAEKPKEESFEESSNNSNDDAEKTKKAKMLPFKDQTYCEAGLQKFLWTRHTLPQIESIFSEIAQQKVQLQPIEEPFVGEDECLQFCMGDDGDMFLDMDLYVLPTNRKDDDETVYLITGIKSSY